MPIVSNEKGKIPSAFHNAEGNPYEHNILKQIIIILSTCKLAYRLNLQRACDIRHSPFSL